MTNKTAKTAPKADDTIKAEDVTSAASRATTKVAEGTREFVRRSAATAKERSDNLYEGSEKLNNNLEGALKRMASGYVSMLGSVAELTHGNVNRALTTVEKLANAKSVSEAVRIQSDYVRDNTSANVNYVRDAAETVRDVASDSFTAARESAMNVWPYGKKAA